MECVVKLAPSAKHAQRAMPDQGDRLLEVGVMSDVDRGVDVIVHAMLARRRFLV